MNVKINAKIISSNSIASGSLIYLVFLRFSGTRFKWEGDKTESL